MLFFFLLGEKIGSRCTHKLKSVCHIYTPYYTPYRNSNSTHSHVDAPLQSQQSLSVSQTFPKIESTVQCYLIIVFYYSFPSLTALKASFCTFLSHGHA